MIKKADRKRVSQMTVIQKLLAARGGARLVASAAILLIFDLYGYDHMSGGFSWLVFAK